MKESWTLKARIMVVTHKLYNNVESELFVPLHVGKKGKKDLGYIGDDTGDNISEKNSNYCELTGHYWMWKNISDFDYIGLCHYRRYFISPSAWNDIKYFIDLNLRRLKSILKKDKAWKERKINIKDSQKLECYLKKSEKYLKENISKFDVILLKNFDLDLRLIDHASNIFESEIKVLREVIADKQEKYLDSYDKVMGGYSMSPCNMFVAKQKIFNDYSEWLFSILFEFEKRIEIPRDVFKARIFGFVSEYLLNVYMSYHKEYKIGRMDMLFVK